MTYVYLLWRHGEYGPVGTVATIDRSAVVALARMRFPEANFAVLGELLTQPDAELARPQDDSDGHSLTNGWGGVHFHVCALEAS